MHLCHWSLEFLLAPGCHWSLLARRLPGLVPVLVRPCLESREGWLALREVLRER